MMLFTILATVLLSNANAEVFTDLKTAASGTYKLQKIRTISFQKEGKTIKARTHATTALPQTIVVPSTLDPKLSGWLVASDKKGEIIANMMLKQKSEVVSLVGWYVKTK